MNLPTRVIAAAVILISGCLLSYGQKRWDAPLVVSSYCSGCHGIDGNAQIPYIPKLAGLNPTYAEKKITAYKELASPSSKEMRALWSRVIRENKTSENVTHEERVNMEGVAHAAKPEAIRQAVLWYAKQSGTRGRAADTALIDQGKELFMNGIPDRNVLACKTCHGANAEGMAATPGLAGQNASYVMAQLAKFRRGDRKHAPEMTAVTRDLDTDQARAVAAYLQSQ